MSWAPDGCRFPSPLALLGKPSRGATHPHHGHSPHHTHGLCSALHVSQSLPAFLPPPRLPPSGSGHSHWFSPFPTPEPPELPEPPHPCFPRSSHFPKLMESWGGGGWQCGSPLLRPRINALLLLSAYECPGSLNNGFHLLHSHGPVLELRERGSAGGGRWLREGIWPDWGLNVLWAIVSTSPHFLHLGTLNSPTLFPMPQVGRPLGKAQRRRKSKLSVSASNKAGLGEVLDFEPQYPTCKIGSNPRFPKHTRY